MRDQTISTNDPCGHPGRLRFRRFFLVVMSCLACFAQPVPAGAQPLHTLSTEQLESVPGVDVAEIVLDHEPIERGMTFDRDGARPGEAPAGDDQTAQTWVVRHGNIPGQTWMRRMLLRVEDEAFRDGQRPAVDVEVQYALDTWAGVEFQADTADDGEDRVAGGWGGRAQLRTKRFSIDNARFDRGLAGSWDLSIAGANAPLHVRRVRVIGYDPREDVRWDRMLRIGSVRGEQPGGVLAFLQGDDQAVSIDLRNLAFVDRPIDYRFVVSDSDGQLMHEHQGELTLAGSQQRDLRVAFDTSEWALGPYAGRLTLSIDEQSEPVLDRPLQLGVVSDVALEKARDGEFLFGLDPGNAHGVDTGTDTAIAWYDLMGVDILRSLPVRAPLDAARMEAAIPILARARLRGGVVLDPVKPDEFDGDTGRQERLLDERAEMIASFVAEHGGRGVGQVHLVELGNEPDLPFFWRGEIALYIQRMEQMAAAIHEAAASAGLQRGVDVLVANGGLSFAGPTGHRRSVEFIERFDPATVDLVAYHAHGPGLPAEQHAHERLVGTLEAAGHEALATVDTETGFAATGPAGEMEQARTAVEKTVYAMSQGQPTLMFFRLYMDRDGPYGLTQNRVEPRPSVLSYRNMVEQLRHHRFVRMIDPPGMGRGINLFLFEHTDEAGDPTGRKVVVVVNEAPAQQDVTLRLDAPAAEATQLQQVDLFGNATGVQAMPGNTATLRVGQDPVFLTWHSPGGADAVQAQRSNLRITESPRLLPGVPTRAAVVVVNPGGEPLEVQLSAEARVLDPVGVDVTPSHQTLTVAPGEQQIADLAVTATGHLPPAMPTWWRVFLDVDVDRMTPTHWAQLPEQLPGPGGTVVGRHVDAGVDNRLDFGALAGGFSERRPAVGFARLHSEQAVELPVGASADWWMAWYVNGEPVYSTLDRGNRHGTLADHAFTLPLQAGWNTIAFQVQSGSGGWSLRYGDQRDVELLRSGEDPNRLTVTMRPADGQGDPIAQDTTSLVMAEPMRHLGGVSADAPLARWLEMQPLATLGEEAVTNFFVTQPDPSRWWQGEQDLSAVVWLRRDAGGDRVTLLVAVRDDVMVAGDADTGGAGDGIRLLLASRDGATLLDQPLSIADAEPGRINGEPVHMYRLQVAADTWDRGPVHLNLRVADRDGDEVQQVLDIGDVDNPTAGPLQAW
jgi:hypothetical protein